MTVMGVESSYCVRQALFRYMRGIGNEPLGDELLQRVPPVLSFTVWWVTNSHTYHGVVAQRGPHEAAVRADRRPGGQHVDLRHGARHVAQRGGQGRELLGERVQNAVLDVGDDRVDIAVVPVQIRGDFGLVVERVFRVELVHEIGRESGVSLPENPLSLILKGARIRANLLRGADGYGENVPNYPSIHSPHATQRMELVAPALKGGQRSKLGDALKKDLLGGGGALVEDGEQTAVETALRVEPLVHALAHHHLPLLLRLLGVDHLLQEERQLTHRAVAQQLGRHGRQLRHLRLLRVGVLDHHLQDATHLQRAEHRVDQPQPVLRRGAMRGDAPHGARDVAHALQLRLQGLGQLEELRLLEEGDEVVASSDLLLVARGTHHPPAGDAAARDYCLSSRRPSGERVWSRRL